MTEIRRLYVQNGQVIQNSVSAVEGTDTDYDSITDAFCQDIKEAFGDYDDHTENGGMQVTRGSPSLVKHRLRVLYHGFAQIVQAMGEAMARGMVLVISLWDDHEAHMLWLDSNYPEDADPSEPGSHLLNYFKCSVLNKEFVLLRHRQRTLSDGLRRPAGRRAGAGGRHRLLQQHPLRRHRLHVLKL